MDSSIILHGQISSNFLPAADAAYKAHTLQHFRVWLPKLQATQAVHSLSGSVHCQKGRNCKEQIWEYSVESLSFMHDKRPFSSSIFMACSLNS